MMNKLQKWIFVGSMITGNLAFAQNLANVNGKAITEKELNAMVETLPEAQKKILMKDPNARAQLIQNLVDQEILMLEANQRKLDQTQDFKDLYLAFRKQAMINLLVKDQLAPKSTKAALKKYYDDHKIRYSTDAVQAYHILAKSEAQAKALLQEVSKTGADFQKIAEAKSADPSAKNNRGDLGYFGRGQFDESFSDLAFRTEVGAVAGPVKTMFGYHILKVVDRKAGKLLSFAEAEDQVKADYDRELMREYLETLKTKYKVKVETK